MEKYNLKGIFFINSFQFKKKFNYHEISKFFIKKYYKSLEKYSNDFFTLSKNRFSINKSKIREYKKKFPYYNLSEIYLRVIRTENFNLYNKVLIKMFKKKKFNYKKIHKDIFMNKSEVINLSKKHVIGLHTHSHLFNFDELNYKNQNREVYLNKKILEKFINKRIFHLSYPIGKYNFKTFKILKKYKIKFAFTNTLNNSKNNFLLPRININTFMIISVLTSSHLRHKYLVSKLSDNFKKVLYINEKKPSIRVKRISIVKNYFSKVKNAEKKTFKNKIKNKKKCYSN